MSLKISLHHKVRWIPTRGNIIKLAFRQRYNIINLSGQDYLISYLDKIKGSKGGNSNVFLLANPNDPKNTSSQIVIKFCNRPLEKSRPDYQRKHQRELIALKKAKESKKANIVDHFHYGVALIHDEFGTEYNFPFYTMEKADSDLSNFLNKNEIDTDQKILICLSILKGFKELHDLEIYHRDIKHDNILMFNRECKIGDLGLVRFRDDDIDFLDSELANRIGAFGWESPETMNKYLTEGNDRFNFDCEIDSISDIFQLGKLFWYIFQGNLPIGQVLKDDFLISDNEIFEMIHKMLQQSKNMARRFQSVQEVEASLIGIAKKYSLV